MQIDTTTSLEQHATWLATNPVIGCPKSCDYCFLHPEGLNQTNPKELWSPIEAIETLVDSPLYNNQIPVAIGTRTDMFVTSKNINYYNNFLSLWNHQEIQNPLIMITKGSVPQETIELLGETMQTGTKPIFYLSNSGIDNTIEKGIDHIKLRLNFKNLADSGVPVVHYWRPFIPQNSDLNNMSSVMDLSAKYARASVIDGLRMTPEMVKQFSFWPEIQEAGIDLSNIESIYTKESQDNLAILKREHSKYPFLFASSCAIANILQIPDYNAVYKTPVCERSACPPIQKQRCQEFHENRNIEPLEIDNNLSRLSIEADYTLPKDESGISTLLINDSLALNLLVNLTQSLKMRVIANTVKDSGYGWGSHHDKKQIFIK